MPSGAETVNDAIKVAAAVFVAGPISNFLKSLVDNETFATLLGTCSGALLVAVISANVLSRPKLVLDWGRVTGENLYADRLELKGAGAEESYSLSAKLEAKSLLAKFLVWGDDADLDMYISFGKDNELSTTVDASMGGPGSTQPRGSEMFCRLAKTNPGEYETWVKFKITLPSDIPHGTQERRIIFGANKTKVKNRKSDESIGKKRKIHLTALESRVERVVYKGD